MRTPDHELRRRILQLQLEQLARGSGPGPLSFELDEAAAVRDLARGVFGELTSIHVDREMPGVFQVGFFTGPRPAGIRGDGQRPRLVVFRARSARELDEQIRTWKAHR